MHRSRPGAVANGGVPACEVSESRHRGSRAKRSDARWKKLVVQVYGRTVTVRVLVIDALWYVAAGSELIRHIVVRDFPGHERDDVFVSTDATLSPRGIIESFARRWSLEVTFHETKGKLGFEDPQNRTERAVERTAPFAFIAYTLVIVWYVLHGHGSRAAQLPSMPWYAHKAVQVCREVPRLIEPATSDPIPVRFPQQLRIDLPLPKHLERLALGVVLEARQPNQRAVAFVRRLVHALHQVLPGADADDVSGRRGHAAHIGRHAITPDRGVRRDPCSWSVELG